MEKKNKITETTAGVFLFKAWCWLVTFLDSLLGNVGKDNEQDIYLCHEQGCLILYSYTDERIKNFNKKSIPKKERGWKNDELQRIIEKKLLGKFRYNNNLKNICIIIPDSETSYLKKFYYDITDGWYEVLGDESMDFNHLSKWKNLSTNNQEIKFVIPEII